MLAGQLAGAEDDSSIMSQPMPYRALRRLEERVLTSEWESLDEATAHGGEGRPRRYFA